jgi:hypothetical protein
MSRPNIAGPTSARWRVEVFAGLDFAVAVDLLMLPFILAIARRGQRKNPRPRSRGFLSKFRSSATRADGVVYYDDRYDDLLHNQIHWRENSLSGRAGQAAFADVFSDSGSRTSRK